MLSQFRSQFFQLPLISSTWTWIGYRYQHAKENSLFPIRLLLTIIEQTILLVYRNLIRPLPQPYHSLLISLDNFLCSHVTSLQYFFPIVNQTFDEVTDYYGGLFSFGIFTNDSKSVSADSTPNVVMRRERKPLKLFDRYFQFLTDMLMSIEIYSKSIENELTDYIDTTRNLWKNLNMEDGRSLDQVESFPEKLLVLGRRMTGNYRQLVYLIGYQFKRCRYILFSCLSVHKRFQSTVWRITRKIQMKQINQKLNDGARHGLVSSKQRVHYYLEMMMLHAAKHPWMRWLTPQTSESLEPEFSKPLTCIRPMFFVPSNNTSDCSGSEENLRDHHPKRFESTPYRRNVIESKQAIEDVLSNISSTSSTVSEQSFDVKDVLRQVGLQTRPTIDSTPSTDEDNQTEIIEQALNDDHDQQQQSNSVFGLSPMLASGCAV